MRTMRWTIPGLVAFAALVGAVRGDEIAIDSAMYNDPQVEVPPRITVFSTRAQLKSLWLNALAHPESDLKRQVAESIANAHHNGMPDLLDTAAPLTKELDAKGQHPLVRLATARALVVLDARQFAEVLFKHAGTDGLDMSLLVEPALAKWDYQPARKVWLERLSDNQVSRQLRLLAIRGLATVGETKANSHLLRLANASDLSPVVRLEAARAVSRLQTEGLQNSARNLMKNRSSQGLVNRLVAVSLLRGHRGKEAESLLLELAVDSEPAVAAIALERLLEIDPGLILPIVERTIASPDAKVRHLGAKALVARPTDKAVTQLGPLLDDPHPEVRSFVRESLFEMASDPQLGLRDGIILVATKTLSSDRWRGLEQSTMLLAALDHKPIADRMVELLEFERPEVLVTAAWSLRRLAIPSTLEAMFDKAQRQVKNFKTTTPVKTSFEGVDQQVSQLFQAFGEMKFRQSDSLLRLHIPKSRTMIESRAAAIWALGHFYAGNPQSDLSTSLSGRIADTNPMNPEDDRVRRMSAASLGRMQAKDALPTLKQFYETETVNSSVGFVCGWAVHQITGEAILKPVV
ncbi:MAG: hypothetical protein IID46_05135, partial [Planctomycetes bacterium]|nr:hypothetical protein [Planctomycetota bacterium]